ncbi:ABC transporter ATP-binding protein/permease [Domibacillus sp. PGB-M46]|uniref:ABC transporter ATP-binding protein n=1 Tax=Domibacillus sp. PGB-M46 TaxID=2910255 RepID=UPI001F59DA5C|nr:ABC transporter ATP-binding protein [Domibacillus sp. PGB-M46]MCI2255193.1 ABC transporter ATP-binding protein/permease [Domibacillus sp. PGB-M46]
MKENVNKLLKLFDKKEKKKLLILFFLMVISAVFETLGIGLIVPFIGIITNPDVIQEQKILSQIYNYFQFESYFAFVLFAVVSLLGVFLLKNSYLLFYNYMQIKVVLNQQVKLSGRLFKEYLTKPYTFHLQRNTADLLRNVNDEVAKVFQGIIMAAFQLLTEILVTVCIVGLLLATAPLATLVAAISLGGSILLFFKVFRRKITHLGKEQQKVTGKMIKWVNQGLGASKEVKVLGKEAFFIDAYMNQSQIRANNSSYMKILEQVPRLFIETLMVAIVLITMLIIVIQGTNTAQLISTMALFAMAAFRLLPSITRIVALITSIKYNQPALAVVYEDLIKTLEASNKALAMNDEPDEIKESKKAFNKEIELQNISFRYPDQKGYSLKDVSLTIPIGQSVAFIGESGAGKTTIVDIILGLLQPEKGNILVDGKNLEKQKVLWQRKIGYIPQSIFLTDDTIRGNVAFGIEQEQINDEDVWRALEQAHLKEFVESLPNKLETQVGERGARLSGGQRQRIGIARSLYHNPEILFMDEATSALDNETEKEIMKAIDGLKGKKTLIIIAHRLSTIENCDTVFKINKGRLVEAENKAKRIVI